MDVPLADAHRSPSHTFPGWRPPTHISCLIETHWRVCDRLEWQLLFSALPPGPRCLHWLVLGVLVDGKACMLKLQDDAVTEKM
jgi:hypothetical protein